jgi:hypothetical protein
VPAEIVVLEERPSVIIKRSSNTLQRDRSSHSMTPAGPK